MKHPKRYCVKCDERVTLIIKEGTGHPMYHCRQCDEEVCRVGDGEATRNRRFLPLGIDAQNALEDAAVGTSLTDIALGNPDVLSDEQTLWPPRAEGAAEFDTAAFLAAVEALTPRQKEVLQAVERFGVTIAAKALNISQPVVSKTIAAIRKKMTAKGYILDKRGNR